MSDYKELARRLRQTPRPPMHFRNRAADAIEALIREKDAAIREQDNVLAEMEAFAKGMAEGAYARGYREGLEKAAINVRSKFNTHGWDYHLPSVGREMEAAIRALIPVDTK